MGKSRAARAFVVLFACVACREEPTSPPAPATPPEPALTGPPVSLARREARVGDRIEVEVRTLFDVDRKPGTAAGEGSASASGWVTATWVDHVREVAERRPVAVDREYSGTSWKPIRMDLRKAESSEAQYMLEALLPDGPVRVGQRWTVDATGAPLGAKAECRLRAVRAEGGNEIAVIAFSLQDEVDEGAPGPANGSFQFDRGLGEIVRVDLVYGSGARYEAVARYRVTAR